MLNFRKIIVSSLLLCMIVTISFDVFARRATLVLKDGRKISGELVSETDSAVTIQLGGIQTPFTRTRIKEVIYELTLDEQYSQKREDIKANDYEGRYKLAEWLKDHYKKTKNVKALKFAKVEVDNLLKVNPDHFKAKLLKRIVDSDLKLAMKSSKTTDDNDEKPDTTPNGKTSSGKIVAKKDDYLSDDDIKLIRTYEVNLKQKPAPRISIPRDVVSELFKKYRDEKALEPFMGNTGEGKFRKLSPAEQLGVIFDARARELYSKVTVRDEPTGLAIFRSKIHSGVVAKYCAQCHTGDQSVGLRLLPGKANDEKVAYSNMMILRMTRIGSNQVINFNQPEKSLLIQYGLARADATTPHPEVPGWRKYFLGTKDPRIETIKSWIGTVYGEAGYPIDYKIPEALPAKSAAKPAEATENKEDTTDTPDSKNP